MSFTRLIPVVACHLLALPGCAGGDDGLGSSAQAIAGGVRSSAFAAVGGIRYRDGLICTGTLVAPDRVLTAAHCFEGASPTQIQAAEFFVGPDVVASTNSVTLASATRHPDFVFGEGPIEPYEQPLPMWNDVAVVALAEPMTVVEPIPIVELGTWDGVGAEMMLVGYGREADSEEFGVRREVTVTVAELTGEFVVYGPGPASACNGDSGGPGFTSVDGEMLQVGITSGGPADCQSGGYYTRLHTHLAWLREQGVPVIAPGGLCATDGIADGVCDGSCCSDPDCQAIVCPNDDCEAAACVKETEDTDGGGCHAAPGSAPWLALLGIAVLVIRRRRS